MRLVTACFCTWRGPREHGAQVFMSCFPIATRQLKDYFHALLVPESKADFELP